MFAGDDNGPTLPGQLDDETIGTMHPNDYIGKSENPIFKKMEEEEDIMRKRINERKQEAERIAEEVKSVTKALVSHGYSQSQINDIFNSGMLTREVIGELLAAPQ